MVSSKWGYTYTAGWQVEAARHEIKDHSLAALERQLAESRALLEGDPGAVAGPFGHPRQRRPRRCGDPRRRGFERGDDDVPAEREPARERGRRRTGGEGLGRHRRAARGLLVRARAPSLELSAATPPESVA